MKKIIGLLVFMLLLPASAFAGRYTIGVEAWVVFWDSAIGAVVAENLNANVAKEVNNFDIAQDRVSDPSTDVSKKPGNGLMMGPSFTWETDDRAWSVTAGGIFSTIISQKIDASGSVRFDTEIMPWPGVVTVPLSITSDIKLTRMEFSAEGRYRFFKYFSAFAGYQYMYYKIDAKFSGGAAYSAMVDLSISRDAAVTSNIHFPLVGLGVEYPVLSWLTLGFDIASGYMFADAEAEFNGSKGDIDIDPNFGMMTALKGIWKVSQSIDITFGYRFQYLSFDMTSDVDLNADSNVPDKTSKNETFHGITFGCRYRF